MDCLRFTNDRITSQAPLLKDLIQFLMSNPPVLSQETAMSKALERALLSKHDQTG